MSIASTTLFDAPDQVLQQALYGSVPEIKPYDALGELNKRVKAKQVSSAMQGNNAIQQAKQMAQQPPVAQQLVAQLNQGVGGLPVQETQSFASGGIVAFNEGGLTTGSAPLYQMAREHGVTLSPYDSPEVRIRKIKEAQMMKEFAEKSKSFGEIPTETSAAFSDPSRKLDTNTATDRLARVGTEKGRATNTGSATFMPPQVAPAAPMVPPTSGGIGGGNRVGSAGSRAGIASLVPPKYNPVNPQYETPEEKSAAQLRAEDEKSVEPAMSEYDTRMGKFKQRALDMQEGKGIKKPSRMERGMTAFMSGASEEYAAARRAGVRPSLGAALGAAGNAAKKGDADLQAKIEAMREKGFEAEQAMEQSRMAYKAGQQELGAKYRDQANRLKTEAMGIRNKMKDNERASADQIAERELKLYELALRKQMADDQNAATLAASRERAAGGGAEWRESNAVLQRYNSNENVKKAAKLRETVALANPNSPIYKRAMSEAMALEKQAANETAAAFANTPAAALAKQVLDGIVGGTSGANPGATQRMRFDAQGNQIK